MAVGLATMLLSRKETRTHNLYFWVACGLVAMGILDAFHAFVAPGEVFVWLHSTAVFFGGLFFLLGALFRDLAPFRHLLAISSGVGLSSIAFGVVFFTMPDLIPAMVQKGEFTGLARSLNMAGGIGCVFAAWKFIEEFRQNGRMDEWLFAIHFLLFGAAGMLFEMSTLWDAGWWWWHLLRLLAYGTGIQCVMMLSQRLGELDGQLATGFQEGTHLASIVAQGKKMANWMPLVIFALVLVVVGLGSTTLYLIQKNLITREGQRLTQIASSIANEMQDIVFERRGDVKILAKAPVLLESDTDSINAYLSYVQETYQAFVGLSFANNDGVILASSNPRLRGQNLRGELLSLYLDDTASLGIQDMRPNPWLENRLTMTLASPVFDPEKQRVGDIVAHVESNQLRRVFEQAIMNVQDEQSSQIEYEWQLLSQDGTILLENVLHEEGEANLRTILVPSAWMVTAIAPGYVEETHVRRQVPVLTGFARMQSIPEVPGFHWGILVRRDQAHVLAEIQSLETKLGLVGIGMTVPLVGLMLVMVRRLGISQKTTVQALEVAQSNEAQFSRMAKEHKNLADQNALILNTVGEGIMNIDNQGYITFANPSALEMLGYESHEAIGVLLHGILYGRNPDGTLFSPDVCPIYKVLLEGTVQQNVEEVFWSKDGTIMSVEYSCAPLQEEQGQILGAVVTFRDVSSRKQTDMDLRNAMAVTQGILDTAVDAIITIDERGTIESFNHAAERIFGYHCEEVLGQNVKMLMPSPYSESHDRYLSQYLETGERKIIGAGREIIALRKDGTIFPIDLSVSEVQLGGHRVFTGMIRDITERKTGERQLGKMYRQAEKTNQELRQARDQALEAVRMKSEFLAMMSHEIRTPMNGVLGMTGILLESELTKDQRECAETVKHSANALLTIINDILDFSKIESGKLEIEVIDFNLRTAIEDVLDLIGSKAEEKGLELVGLVYASLPTAVRGDPGRFRQILLNLVGNAIKFTEQGEVVIQVLPERESTEEVYLRVEVTDTGIGITEEEQRRLFQPFCQADGSTTRKYGGTGLGLAICKQLVELMGGTIGVYSKPGYGSSFWFTVRLEKQPEQPDTATEPNTNLEGLRICVVDANDTNRLLFHDYATSWGMICEGTENGEGALKVLKQMVAAGTPCDLLLLDMHTLGSEALDLAKRIKEDPSLTHVKLVLVTTMGRRGDAKTAQKAGIAAYLTKPIHHDQLRDCLSLVMRGGDASDAPLITKYTLREAQQHREGRLLVADDNIVNQKVAVRMLEKLGYRVDVVANGCEAVEAVSRIAYDAVLMDCQMPEMDGYEATREIRKREAENGEDHNTFAVSEKTLHASRNTLPVPIIAMTANAMKGDREKCLEAGMDDFVSKPVRVESLEAVLANWISKKEGALLLEGSNGTKANDERHTQNKEHPMNEDTLAPALDVDTLEGLKELGDGDPSFLVEVIQQFLQDAPGHVEAIRQAAAEGNADSLMKAAHAFKGSCRNMGALPLGEICYTLEQKGRDGHAINLEDLVANLQTEQTRVHQALEAQLAELSVGSDS